jgi:hypothetical protein
MPTIEGASGIRTLTPGREPSARSAAAVEGPVLPEGDLYGMGLEFIAAALASKAAECTLKLSREAQRAERMQQASEQKQQSEATREKAGALRLQASVSGGLSIAGGALSFGGAMKMSAGVDAGPKAATTIENGGSKALGALGSTTSSLAQPTGTMMGGARSVELEATSADHASRAKLAEGVAEELATLERQARSIVEKATALMQALVQERQANARAILRAG